MSISEISHEPSQMVEILLSDLELGTLVTGTEELSGTDGLSADWPIFVGNLPDAGDNILTVIDREGELSRRTQHGTQFDFPGLQILVQARRSNVAFLKAKTLYATLSQEVAQQTILVDQTYYTVTFKPTTVPVPLGRGPDNHLYTYSLNFLLTVSLTDVIDI